MNNSLACFENVIKDLRVNDLTGQGFISQRALAKLCGLPSRGSWNKSGRKFGKNVDEYLASLGIEVASFDYSNGVPDLIAAEVIAYYAEEIGNSVAKQTSRAFRAIGLRTVIQQQCGWKPPVIGKLTPKEIVNMLVLPEAKEWSLRFPKEYYDQLARLTGLISVGHKRPTLWGKLTKEWVYDYLPQGVYDRLKELQTTHKGHPKLHQFLIEDTGIALLTEHYNALMTLMYASENIFQVSQLLQTRKNVTTKIFEAQQIKTIAASQ